jgi:ABC-type transporter Mla MlaB component
MDLVLRIVVVLLSLVLLWSGLKHLEFSSLARTLLSIVELAVFVIAVSTLGWVAGALVVIGVSTAAVMVWSVKLAMGAESKLVYAGIQIDESKETMKALEHRLRGREAMRAMGPLERSELIRLLAERTRKVKEIEEMAVPIAMLKSIYSADLAWLVESFDRLLRLAHEPASKAGDLADTLHNTTCGSPSTFREIVDGFITVYDGLEDLAAA